MTVVVVVMVIVIDCSVIGACPYDETVSRTHNCDANGPFDSVMIQDCTEASLTPQLMLMLTC